MATVVPPRSLAGPGSAVLAGALLALGVAALLRQALANHSFWFDEAYVILNVARHPCGELLSLPQPVAPAPPLYLCVLRGLYLLFGPAEWAMRLPSLLASLAALAGMVPLARRVVGGSGWLWAVALCAASNHLLSHSYQAKPYAFDLLATVLVLLSACGYLAAGASARARRWGLAGLLAGAVFLPWLSFPSVFVLGGASLAVLSEASRRRSRALAAAWAVLSALLVLSFVAVWWLAARRHNSAQQQSAFAPYFPDLGHPLEALAWLARSVVRVGEYGNAGLGVPLALLAALGAAALWRRGRAPGVLLVGPLALAVVAAGLRQYPLGDRLCLFAVPCVWLLAAGGAGAVAGRLRGRWAWAGVVLAVALLLPGLVRTGRYAVVACRCDEFREAFAYARRHLSGPDKIWVLHAEVYQVYHGDAEHLLGWYTPPADLEAAARAGRVWAVTPPPELADRVCGDRLRVLRAAGAVPVGRRRFGSVEVVVYAPPGGRVDSPKR